MGKKFSQVLESFELFLECDGFNFLKTQTQQDLMILSSLSFFEYHQEIDQYINSLPSDSPLFKIDQTIIKNLIFVQDHLRIPSLVHLVDQNIPENETNEYLIGKVGLNSSRFITISVFQNYINKFESLLEKIEFNENPFSLYEFGVSKSPSFFRYDNSFYSISFWIRLPSPIPCTLR